MDLGETIAAASRRAGIGSSAFPLSRRSILRMKNRTYCQRGEKEERGDFHSSIKPAKPKPMQNKN